MQFLNMADRLEVKADMLQLTKHRVSVGAEVIEDPWNDVVLLLKAERCSGFWLHRDV